MILFFPQLYHHCLYGIRNDFICANYTAFDQRTFICHFVSEVDCVNSPKFFKRLTFGCFLINGCMIISNGLQKRGTLQSNHSGNSSYNHHDYHARPSEGNGRRKTGRWRKETQT
jgi:Chitin binding Peritrophin-A domain